MVKGSEWSRSKRINAELTREFRSIPGKKKYECKKLKGEHKFELKATKTYTYLPGPSGSTFYEYRCVGCNKKKVEVKRGLQQSAQNP